ncbi:MAG: hypothetical protein ACR2OG_10335, partial [Gemmatimonadaceae bacterium]
MVSNDAYAPAGVWETFGTDSYHSPRVVWGREVNQLRLGLGGRIAAAAAADPGPANRAGFSHNSCGAKGSKTDGLEKCD